MTSWRAAREADHAALLPMFRRFYEEDPAPTPIPDEHMRATLAALGADATRGRVVVLDEDGRAEGYALLIPFWSNELGGEVCMIDEIFVAASQRGRGEARALIESIAAGLPPWGRRPVALQLEVSPKNERARALYARLGFTDIRNALMRLRVP